MWSTTLLTCGGPGLRKQDIQDEAFDLCDCPCWVLVASQRGVGTTCVLVKQAAASAAAATALAAALGMMLAAVAVAAAAAEHETLPARFAARDEVAFRAGAAASLVGWG